MVLGVDRFDRAEPGTLNDVRGSHTQHRFVLDDKVFGISAPLTWSNLVLESPRVWPRPGLSRNRCKSANRQVGKVDFRGEIRSSSKASRARTAGSRSPSLLERRMVSAIDRIRAEPTG